jgi:hypothetical protein
MHLHYIKKKWSNLDHKVTLGASIIEAIISNPGQDTGTHWTNAEYLEIGLEYFIHIPVEPFHIKSYRNYQQDATV